MVVAGVLIKPVGSVKRCDRGGSNPPATLYFCLHVSGARVV